MGLFCVLHSTNSREKLFEFHESIHVTLLALETGYLSQERNLQNRPYIQHRNPFGPF